MTARELLAALQAGGHEIEVDGTDVLYGSDVPPELDRAIQVMSTGLRAVLAGKRWFGVDGRTGKPCGPHPKEGRGPLAFGALSPAALLPANVSLLCVEGDGIWDRLDHSARLDLAHLFATETERGRSR